MYIQIFCLVLLALVPAAAHADPAHYTTLGAKRGKLNPPELSIKSLNYAQEEEARKQAAQTQTETDKTFEDVWAKYQALAAGTAGTAEPEKGKGEIKRLKPLHVKKPEAVEKPETLPKLQPAAGGDEVKSVYKEKPLAGAAARTGTSKPRGILDQYEESKAKRSQMKMIRLGVPKDLAKEYQN